MFGKAKQSQGSDGKSSDDVDWLLRREEAPRYRTCNPYILTGYLPPLSWCGCLRSMFYLHNETGNIVTHSLPLLLIMILGPWWKALQGLCLIMKRVVLVLMALPWAASSVYHTFMPHRGGRRVYRLLLGFDMLAICTSVCFGQLPHVYVAGLALSKETATVTALIYCHACLYALRLAVSAETFWQCRLCFLPPLLLVVTCWLLRVSHWGVGHCEGVIFVPPMLMLFVMGGLMAAMLVPERWAPGHLDFVGHSHQIMHVMVVAAQYCMFRSALADLKWLMRVGPQYHG